MPPPFYKKSWHLLQKSWHLLQFHKQQNGQPCDHPLLLTAKHPHGHIILGICLIKDNANILNI
nr:MAG TPA: hypothetical protein [Caudoviricetes sp.]